MASTVLVLLMTIPGLALFYGGLVRAKNMLSVLMQVFYCVCIVGIIWVLYGYSLTFTGGSAYIGGFSKAFLAGITTDSKAATFSVDANVSEIIYVCFQMTFAMITPALIVGAFAERMKFAALALFIPLWVTFIYFPIAHMVWYWAGPDSFADAAKALAAAGGEKNAEAKTAYDLALLDAGKGFQWGVIDFAGGTVVHINSGIAGFVGALILGKRVGYGRESMAPHSLTMAMIGAALLWVGWFGFNAGSALEASGTAALAMTNTFVATAAAALAWLVVENMTKGKPSLLGAVTGAVAGLVAVTPASGYAGPMGAIVLGLVAGVGCFIACSAIKNALGYDDARQSYQVTKLYLMNRDGSGSRLLTKDLDRDASAPRWSADSKSIYFLYTEQGNTKLALCDLAGKRTFASAIVFARATRSPSSAPSPTSRKPMSCRSCKSAAASSTVLRP